MLDRKLIKDFKRGLGRAILQIKKTQDKNKYFNEVLWLCLRDVTYDFQAEGTKGVYIYDAICETKNQVFFENQIINKYLVSKNERYNIQSAEVLAQFALNGSENALTALLRKYNDILETMNKRRKNYRRTKEFENLAIRITRIVGIDFFEKYICDLGLLIQKHNSPADFRFELFILASEDSLGKKVVEKCLKRIENRQGVAKMLRYIENNNIATSKYQEQIDSVESLNDYYNICVDYLKDPSESKMCMLVELAQNCAYCFTEIQLVYFFETRKIEKNEFLKALLLKPFEYRIVPSITDQFLDYALSENMELAKTAIEVLKRNKSQKIYNLAIELCHNDKIELALPLFKNNYTQVAEDFIRKFILKKKNINHKIQSIICDIYKNNISKTSGDILYHIYKNANSAYERYDIVRAYYNTSEMPNKLLLECTYDSCNETREWANKVAKFKTETSAMAIVFCGAKILTTIELVYEKIILSLPKGHVEDNETHIEAAIRECFEETDVILLEKNVIKEAKPFEIKFCDHHDNLVKKTICPIIFRIAKEARICPKEERIIEAKFMDIDLFLKDCTYDNVKEIVLDTLKCSV